MALLFLFVDDIRTSQETPAWHVKEIALLFIVALIRLLCPANMNIPALKSWAPRLSASPYNPPWFGHSNSAFRVLTAVSVEPYRLPFDAVQSGRY
jgi:hypothetical protein